MWFDMYSPDVCVRDCQSERRESDSAVKAVWLYRHRRIYVFFMLAVFSFFFSVSVLAADVNGVRVWYAPDHTRLVFDLSGKLEHKLFALSNPHRLVIDLKNARLKSDFSKVKLNKKRIKSIRSAVRSKNNLRVVLDLPESVTPRSFALKPNEKYGQRLVVDLYGKNHKSKSSVVPSAKKVDKNKRDVVVVIDAGHGGDDPGAVGYKKTYEKNVVLSIAKELAELLRKETGFKSVLVRKGDYYVPLRKRTEIARKHRADLFVSIHADSFKNSKARGASIYALSERGASSETARWLVQRENSSDLVGGVGGVSLDDKDDVLAHVLLDLSMTASLSASLDVGKDVLGAMGKVSRLHSKKVGQAGFVVLKSPDIPSILVETGYLSNPTEAKLLRTKKHRRALAKSIFKGVQKYFGKTPPPGSWLAWQKHHQNELALHTIERGDTLSGIAQRYRTSVGQLRQLNALRSDNIRIGQKIKVPAS